MDYSKIIKIIREKMLISQEELAILIGVSFATINRWENGHYNPTMKSKRKIKELCEKHNINF